LNFLRTFPLLLVACIAVAGYAACGGDDDESEGDPTPTAEPASKTPANGDVPSAAPGGPLTLEGYFEQMETIGNRADQDQETIVEDLEAAEYDTPEAELEGLQGGLVRTVTVLETALAEADALHEPPEVAEKHAAFVEALRAVVAVTRQFYVNTTTVATTEELEVQIGNYNVDFGVADADFDNACEDLQKIANDADIERKMCGD
jgi:hypothetical protein